MLTESEREWLERREVIHQCEGDYIWAGYWEEGVELAVMQDAAEFSERVAAKLAKKMLEPNRYPCRGGFPSLGCMRDRSDLTGPMAVHCEDCVLREVRLQVEEEMDGE